MIIARVLKGHTAGGTAFAAARLFLLTAAFSAGYLLLSAAPACPEGTHKFTYQGNLRQGGFLVNGYRKILFNLYPSSTSIAPVWSSVNDVLVSTGVFRVGLEPSTTVYNYSNLWLELVVDVNDDGTGGTRLLPWEEITASPFSLNAIRLSGKKYPTSAVPPLMTAEGHALGDLWMDSIAKVIKFWDGTAWIPVSGTGLPGVHAPTHAGTGTDPITSLGSYTETGYISFLPGSALSVGAGATQISVVGALVSDTGLGAPQVKLAENVVISSEASPDMGGGVRISSNVYIVGFASATKFYGDGSGLTGIGSGAGSGVNADTLDSLDSLDFVRRTGYRDEEVTGVKLFTSSMAVAGGIDAFRLKLAENVEISSDATGEHRGGVVASSNVYVHGDVVANSFWGDGAHLTGIGGGGGATVNSDTLDFLDSLDFVRKTGDLAETVTGPKQFSSSATFTAGLGAERIELRDNVAISSEPAGEFGGGVRISSNVYIIGFASATKYYGDGSALTGLDAAQNANFLDYLDSLDFVRRTGNMTEDVNGFKTFTSSVTVTGQVGATGLKLADNVLVSSETLADLGGGVRISSNVYIVGFASAAKFYGDGSSLTGLDQAKNADTLDFLHSTDYVRASGDVIETITGAKLFSSSVTVPSAVGTPRLELGTNVVVAVEPMADLGAGVNISTNVFAVGFVTASKFYGDGSNVTALDASNLDSGVVPLDRLEGITHLQLAGDADIQDTQLSTISTPGKVFDSALSSNVSLLDAKQEITGIKTFTSSVTVAATLGSPRLELGDNVSISSEPAPELGGGLTISSNVYIVGFASATKYYGDGSSLSMGASLNSDTVDNLHAEDFVRKTGDLGEEVTGAKTFLSSVTVAGAVGAQRLDLADNVSISSYAPAELGGGLTLSTNAYIVGFASATKYYGDGSELAALNASNLASGTVPLERLQGLTSSQISADAGILDTQLSTISTPGRVFDSALSDNVSLLSATQTVTGAKIFTSSVSVTLALSTPRLELAENVAISSEASVEMGAGVVVSTNLYIVGFSSAAMYYGDGSGLTGLQATYAGATSALYNGAQGGYGAVNTLCAAEFPGSHVCSTGEIIFSINTGKFAAFPAGATMWISNGPPGYTATANDCIGWTSAADTPAGVYGAVWNKEATGDGYGTLNRCDGVIGSPRQFACCGKS